jgi:hypothetical protein
LVPISALEDKRYEVSSKDLRAYIKPRALSEGSEQVIGVRKDKLDPTAEKGILVGYSETSKTYRIYIPSTRKTILRRDVKFEEERAL